MAIVQTQNGKSAAGGTVLHYGANWTASGSEPSTVSETSLFQNPGGSAAGPLDVSNFEEGVILVNVTAISGAAATLTIKVYAVDSAGTRYTALVTRTVTATGASRDIVPVPQQNPGSTGPMGNFIEVTKTFTGTTPTCTATVELQVKT